MEEVQPLRCSPRTAGYRSRATVRQRAESPPNWQAQRSSYTPQRECGSLQGSDKHAVWVRDQRGPFVLFRGCVSATLVRLIALSLRGRLLVQWLDGDQRTPVTLAVLKRGLLLFHADSPLTPRGVSSDTDSHPGYYCNCFWLRHSHV